MEPGLKRARGQHITGSTQLVGSNGAEADGVGDSHELLPREHDADAHQQPPSGQEDGQPPEHGGLDLHTRAGQRTDPQDAAGVRRGGRRELCPGLAVQGETPGEPTIEHRISTTTKSSLGGTYGSQRGVAESARSQGGRCSWSDLRGEEAFMPLRPDGKTSPGSDGRSELRSDILPMPPTNRASMPIFHVDNTAAFPRCDQLEVPGSRAREDTTGRGTSADGSGEVHTPKEDPAGNQWIGRPRDVQDLSQDPQAGAQDHLQGQGQIRNNINGICRDGRVPQVPGLAPGRTKSEGRGPETADRATECSD